MAKWRHCHICHKWGLEETMRMHGDDVWTHFTHKQGIKGKWDDWYEKIKAKPIPPVITVNDFFIPIDQRRCPAAWYAHTFDGKGKSMKPDVKKS